MAQERYRGLGIDTNDFVANPSPRLPCVLLLDSSYSMSGQPIAELNAGLAQYRDELLLDGQARRSVEVSVVRFGGDVEIDHDFETAENFSPPALVASGNTPMAEAVLQAVRILEARKAVYATNGVPSYRPWLFLITDGEPTDSDADWKAACEAVRFGEDNRKFSFFAVGTDGANFTKLRQLSSAREPLKLKGIAFRELFKWMSSSQTRISQTAVGPQVALPPPDSWAQGWDSAPT